MAGGVGWGLDDDVCQTYDFVSNNYEPGDELFFFGFSRGAFTVRSAANLVCEVGILSAVHMSHFADMWAAYRSNTAGKSFRNSTWYLENKEKLGLLDVRVKVVGVWDTVGALVWSEFTRTVTALLIIPRVSRSGLSQAGRRRLVFRSTSNTPSTTPPFQRVSAASRMSENLTRCPGS